MSLAEAEAWAPAEKLSCSEWAERYRKLGTRGRAEGGPYRLKRTPYLREILDVLGDTVHEEVWLMKPPQVGGSELGRTAIGFWVDTRGDPILIVYPNEAAAGEEITERVAPMFEESPRLARHLTGRVYDVNESEIKLASCSIRVGWAGSPQALASRPAGCAVLEETDKYQRKGSEAPPDDLARHRLKTFRGRRKLFGLSTPTTKSGTVCRNYTDIKHKREYTCPCPGCGASQVWSFEHVRWDGWTPEVDARDPEGLLELVDQIETGAARAWVECSSCGHAIHEQDRMRAVELGEWRSKGHPPGVFPRSKRIAYHVESLVSPWVTFGDYVVAYLRGVLAGDLQDFLNGFRGLPAEEVSGKVQVSVFEERGREHRAWVVPAWATTLTAGADTQATGGRPWWAWVIRAWGPGLRSRLVGWGRADSVEELKRATVDARFPVEGGDRFAAPALLCVDSGGAVDTEDGSTTDLVYAMAKRDPARVVAVKGYAGPTRPDRLIAPKNVDYQPRGMPPTTVLLHTLDTERLKDVLARLIRSESPVLWEESAAADKVYAEQMTAEERVLLRTGKKKRMTWVNTTRRRNDLWDATVYALAAAKILRVEERHLALEGGAKVTPAAPAKQTPRGPEAVRGDEDKQRRFGARVRDRGRGGWVTRRER